MKVREREGGRVELYIFYTFLLKSLFNVKAFRLFNGKGEFVVEFLVRFVRWKVNAIEAR